VSSTEETFFAFSAADTSTAVLKLHGDLAKAHSRLIDRSGADDAQFGQALQEQWLYSGISHHALLTHPCLCVRFKQGDDHMAEINISRRHVLAVTGGALMGESIGNSMAATFDGTVAKPSEAGFADDLDARLDKAIADRRIWNMHSLIVIK